MKPRKSNIEKQPKKQAVNSGARSAPVNDSRYYYFVLAAVLLLVYSIRSNFYEIPFERDEGAYGYYGKLLLSGKTPYVDFYEQKFPGIFYFYALMVGIFGATVKGLHIGFMVLNMGTIVLLFAAARRLFGNAPAVVAAATYAVVSMTPNLSGFTVQSEHGVAFFSALGIFLYTCTRARPRWYWFFVMGLAMGAAFMVKTTGVFLALWGGLAVLLDFFFQPHRNLKEFSVRVLAYSIGGLLVIAMFFLVMFLKGAFDEMVFWTFEVPRKYVSLVKWEEGKTYLKMTYQMITENYKVFWFLAYGAALCVFAKFMNWRQKLVLLSLFVFSALTIFPGFFFYGHYWIQLLPGLAIATGLTAYMILQLAGRFVKWNPGKLAYVFTAIFLILVLVHVNKNKDYYYHPNYDLVMRKVYGNNPFPEAKRIADYIKANSKPGDGLVSIGSEPQLYFYTGIDCPSRHAYFTSLVFNSTEHKTWQREFVADVEKASPRYIVFFNHPISLMVQPNTDRYIWEWYDQYIKNYNLVGAIEMPEGYVNSNYYWNADLANFKGQSQIAIYVYERKG